MKCNLCGSQDVLSIHHGTRDNPAIDVYQCKKCKLKFLSDKMVDKVEDFYEKGGMHNLSEDTIDVEKFLMQTKDDDIRRSKMIHEYITGKEILDFGCGWGGGYKTLLQVG